MNYKRVDMVNSKQNWVSYSYIMVMLVMTFPVFKSNVSSNLAFAFCWIISISIAILFLKNYTKSNLFISLLVYSSIVLLNYLSGDVYFYSHFYVLNEFFMLFISTSMVWFYIPNIKRSKFDLLLLLFGLFLIESAIVSFYITIDNPGLLRQMSSEEGMKDNYDVIVPYFKIGMSDYSIPHALPIIIPGLVYAIKKTKYYYKVFYIVVLISSVILANSSGSVTALLLSILSLFLSLIISGKSLKRSKNRIVVALIIFMPFFLNQSMQLSVFDTIGNVFPENNYLQTKIDDMKASIISDRAQGTVASREDKYNLTFDAIVNNIIIGTNEKFGGHSTIPDRWATLGIVGFIPYILFLCFSIKYVLKFIRGSSLYYYYIGAGIALLLLLTKSMGAWLVWFSFLFLLPCTLVYYSKDVETCKLKG